MAERIRTIRDYIVRFLVLLLIFITSVIIFSRIINQTTPETASDMATSTFPLVYMNRDGVDFNCLHGYAREMNSTRLRDTVTPLEDDRSIGLRVETFGANVESVVYEVITLDGTQVLENTKVVKLTGDGDDLTADLTLGSGMLMNREYVLEIQVTFDGRTAYYYTHVLLADGLHTMDYLNYVSGFYEKCVNKTDLTTVGAAVEPDETTDADSTLAVMDIHDSVRQLTWGDLNPQIYYKPTPRLTEINENTATLTLDYRIASVADNGITQLYNVHEYYRVRFTDSRVFLLNFERTTDEIFNPDGNVMTSTGINLGITDRDVEYATDDTGRMIAFVQEEELWTYGVRSGKLTQVFSFPQKENMDARDFYADHTIRILRLNEDGDVWFAVSGYMNRGQYEGENGIGLFFYDAGTATVSEPLFLRSTENTELLQRETGACLYLTEDESKLYVLLDGLLCRVTVADAGIEVLESGIACECSAASASGRYLAWLPEGSVYDSSSLSLIDLETEEVAQITAPEGERVRALTFMKEDLVAGYARADSIQADHGGCATFPMHRLEILNGAGEVIKTYAPSGMYVLSVSLTENVLYLERATYADGTYTAASQDQIMSTDTEEDVAIGIATQTSAKKQTEVLLRVGSTSAFSSAQVIRSKCLTAAGLTADLPENPQPQSLYYVYAGGTLAGVYTYPNDAVTAADAAVGVVVDSSLDYVWVRGDRDNSAEIRVSSLPTAVAEGMTDTAQLSAALGQTVLDVSGCTLDEVLYFISHGSAVIAQSSEGVRVIVGYDEFNTYLLTPGEDSWEYFGMNDSTELFANSGNVFYTY